MARKKLIIPLIALASCLLVRDVAACLNFLPGYFIYAEILAEKENSEKSEKEGKKEMDESKIPVYISSAIDLLISDPSLPAGEGLRHTFLPSKILYPPPRHA